MGSIRVVQDVARWAVLDLTPADLAGTESDLPDDSVTATVLRVPAAAIPNRPAPLAVYVTSEQYLAFRALQRRGAGAALTVQYTGDLVPELPAEVYLVGLRAARPGRAR